MTFKSRKIVFIFLFIFLAAILFVWFSVKKVEFYVNNPSVRTYCLYVDAKFLSVIPSKSTVELRLKSSNNAIIGVSEKIDGMFSEEFSVKLGGRSQLYNITDLAPTSINAPSKDTKHALLTSGKIPKNAIQKITLDTLHRIIMNKLPSKMETLKRFTQIDAIKMAGDIGDISSTEWLLAILKLPEHRTAWEEALRSIGKIGGNNALVILRKYIRNEEMDIVIGSIDGLALTNTSAAQQVLIEAYYATEQSMIKKAIISKMIEMPLNFDIKAFVLRELDKGSTVNLDSLLQIVGKNKIKEAIPILRKLKAKIKTLTSGQILSINSTIRKIS
jgi:hypothetical protein